MYRLAWYTYKVIYSNNEYSLNTCAFFCIFVLDDNECEKPKSEQTYISTSNQISHTYNKIYQRIPSCSLRYALHRK